MMEDKLQGLLDDGLTESQAVGRVIAEFGTLEEAAPVLGIDTELGRTPSVDPLPAAPRSRSTAPAPTSRPSAAPSGCRPPRCRCSCSARRRCCC